MATMKAAIDHGNRNISIVPVSPKRGETPLTIANMVSRYNGEHDGKSLLSADVMSDMVERTISKWVIVNGEEYIVGKAAELVAPRSMITMTGTNRYGSDQWKATFGAALTMYDRSGSIELTYMVPISVIRSGKWKEVEDAIMGQDWHVMELDMLTGEVTKDVNFQIESMEILPEGLAGWFRYAIRPDGYGVEDEWFENNYCIIDVGGHSTDIVMVEEANPTTFETVPVGMYTIQREVKDYLLRETAAEKIPERYVFKAVQQGEIHVPAQQRTVSVQGVVDTFVKQINDVVMTIWNQHSTEFVHRVFVIGGGGPFVGPQLAKKLNHGDIVIEPEGEAHLINLYGAQRWRQMQKVMSEQG